MSKPKIPEKLRKPMRWESGESPEHFIHRRNRVSFLNSLIDCVTEMQEEMGSNWSDNYTKIRNIRKKLAIVSGQGPRCPLRGPLTDKPEQTCGDCTQQLYCCRHPGFSTGGWPCSYFILRKVDNPLKGEHTCGECEHHGAATDEPPCNICSVPDSFGSKDYFTPKKEHACEECSSLKGAYCEVKSIAKGYSVTANPSATTSECASFTPKKQERTCGECEDYKSGVKCSTNISREADNPIATTCAGFTPKKPSDESEHCCQTFALNAKWGDFALMYHAEDWPWRIVKGGHSMRFCPFCGNKL